MSNTASNQSVPQNGEVRFQVVDGGAPSHLGYFSSAEEADKAIDSGRYGSFGDHAYAVEAED